MISTGFILAIPNSGWFGLYFTLLTTFSLLTAFGLRGLRVAIACSIIKSSSACTD